MPHGVPERQKKALSSVILARLAVRFGLVQVSQPLLLCLAAASLTTNRKQNSLSAVVGFWATVAYWTSF